MKLGVPSHNAQQNHLGNQRKITMPRCLPRLTKSETLEAGPRNQHLLLIFPK